MTRFLLIGSTIGLTLLSSVAFAGGGVRDHRHGGSPYGQPQGGVRVYSGHRPHLGYGYHEPQVRPAPSGNSTSGATIRDHRSHHPHYGGYGGGATVRDHRSPYGGATVRDHRGLSSPLVKGPFF